MSTVIDTLTFDGQTLGADIRQMVTGITVNRTIDGASTLEVTVRDVHRHLIRSTILTERITAQFDGHSYELVAVRKSGLDVTITFEDLAIAALRKHKTPIKAAAGTVTRAGFMKRLINEEPWLVPVLEIPDDKAHVEFARGSTEPQPGQKPEDSWTALRRLADERNWRVWSKDNEIWVAEDQRLLRQEPFLHLTEQQEGVDVIDFDHDAGQPAATATVSMRVPLDDPTGETHALPGKVALVHDLGLASGHWLIEGTRRSPFSTLITLSLTKPEPTLPEPPPPSSEPGYSGEGAGTAGAVVGGGTVSSKGFMLPLRGGKVISVWGDARDGGRRRHAGWDVGGPRGAPVLAAKDGTVTVASGGRGGLGNGVTISHGNGVSTVYGHLEKIMCKRGQIVKQGQQIGTNGTTGNAKGTTPHVHLEIHINGRAVNPAGYFSR